MKIEGPGPTGGRSWVGQFGRLAVANILSNLMVPLAGIIDTAFLGHLAEIRYLAGVALATVIFNVIYWSFGFLRMGTTGLTAQAIGRGDTRQVWLIGVRGGVLALGLGLLILVLQVPLRELGFALLQAEPSVLAAGRDFYNGRIWDAPAVLINYVLLGWFLGQSQGRRVIVLATVGSVANVLLDYWFIRQLGWASYGAGLATALSQYLALLTGLALLPTIPWRMLANLPLWEVSALKSFFQLNRDILIRTLALVLCFAMFTFLSARLGQTILAVNTLLLQVLTLVAYFLDGIAFATESYAGQFFGQQAWGQLRQLLQLSAGLSVALGVGFAIAVITLSQPFFSLLTHHQEVLTLIPTYVGWLLPVFTFGAIAFMLDGYFLGLTAGQSLRNSTVIASVVGFAPVAIAAYWLQSAHLLWVALTCFMALRAITLGAMVPITVRNK